MKTYVGIARDHSGSMSGLRKEAKEDFNQLIDSLKQASNEEKIDTIVNSVTFGIHSSVQREAFNSSLNAVDKLTDYKADGQTPLWDAVGELIDMMSLVPDINESGVSFLVMVITDGQENSSIRWSANSLMKKIKELQSTDKWTFTFRVPQGYASQLSHLLGIPRGNVVEWEQTERGIRGSMVQTQAAVRTLYQKKKQGIQSSSSFYADLSQVTMKEVKNTLTDISAKVTIWKVKDGGIQIRDFVEKKKKEYQLGCAFYQLTKREEVQGQKLFVIRHKISGKVYSGEEARDMMGLPIGGSIKMAPGDHGDYDIFVQSTSINRKLIAGTELLYWPGAKSI